MQTAFVWDDALASYRFTATHPMNPRRLQLTLELIRRLGLIEADQVVAPRRASDDELLLAHAPELVDAVRRASAGEVFPGAARFGLGTDDVPIVEGMHDAAAHIVGATLTAAELVMSGRAKRAFNISGGLHHARRAESAGFCVYNDLAVAIRWMQKQHGARVLYIDYDAHHGDGVQWIFYDDPDALTLSFHESGAFLFPGTGFVEETGAGDGVGYSVNMPLDAHTEDDSFEAVFRALVPDVVKAYEPDVIVLQCGCDAHVLDPLTHLRCTTGLFERMTRLVCDVADEHCEGRVVATGGGGYAIYKVVPRAWTLVWAALNGIDAPDVIPDDYLRMLRLECGELVPSTLRDAPDAFLPSDRRAAATETNTRTLGSVRRAVLPLLTGWGLGF